MFSRGGEPGTTVQPGAGGWMSNVFSRVKDKVEEAISPRVVQPSQVSTSRSWESSSGVIRTSELTHFERISLNAMEERVLPPDVRIKIVCAQASAVEQEEELLEANANRLDGLVRTLALYGVLQLNAIDESNSDKLSPDREQQLGKMLVAAVQLELFRMLDDICEAGDMENELFHDLCADTIQDGRRNGFIYLTADLLLSPGSGYKRLLQIRKDQMVEDIADVAGLRALGGHDCQRDSSESPELHPLPAAMGSDCGSPGSAAGGPGLKITRGAGSVSAALSVISPSPSSQRPADSLSPSPENGHRRTQTQRVRDLLSSIDGLVMESEQPEEAPSRLSPFSPSNNPSENGGGRSSAAPAGAAAPLSRSVRGYKRQSTGAVNPRGGGRSPRMSLRTPPPAGSTNGGGEEEDHRSPSQRAAFFPNERDWRGGPFGATHPPELAGRPASVIPDPGAEDGDDPAASADMLLAEVDWLIAGTNAALGKTEGGSTIDENERLEATPDKRELLLPARDDAPDSAEATRVAATQEDEGGRAAELVDPVGNSGLEITPDKRGASPEGDDAPETVGGATRVAGGEEEGDGVAFFGPEGSEDALKGVGGGVHSSSACAGECADSQRAGVPSPTEASLTASPSPETRLSSSSPIAPSDAEEEDGDGEILVLEGAMEGSEIPIAERSPTAPSVEPAVAGDAPAGVAILEDVGGAVARKEEGDEQPAVVGSGASGSDRLTGARNGDAGSPLDPNEERAEPEGGAAGLGNGDGAASRTGTVGSTGASDLDASTAVCLNPEPEADASLEAGEAIVPGAVSGGDLPPLPVVPEPSKEAAVAQFVQEAVSFGDSGSGPDMDVRGSREDDEVVAVEDGADVGREAQVSTFEDVEL